ncbi:VOC family protein [Xanthovirga aplysinae]|uniref:VOC family protein n=1 Tax=Xanthovirga aplysinae TaxID=2529853 RepID=UPI0012BCF462|nr:VOC family protein [Xanthovirga aplysinae]MTI32280.1 bleomycin resistance protein [Xanthovirga aplysinae]
MTKNHIGRIVLLVEDYEEAYAFYHKNFGFKKLFDLTTDVGQRFLHVGTEASNAIGIWFLKAEGKEQIKQIGKQTSDQPTMVIYTNSLMELYERIKNNSAKIKTEPVITPEYKFFHCFDLYGNELVVVELPQQ